jgi:hypothetical protein
MPWSPSFMAIYEAAMTEMPAVPTIGASRTVPGTVNAAMVSYYQSSFGIGIADSTKKAFRAILETFRAEHGDKRVALMHGAAMQNIINKKKPVAQRNFKKAMRGFLSYCIGQNLISSNPLANVELAKIKKTGGHHTWMRSRNMRCAMREGQRRGSLSPCCCRPDTRGSTSRGWAASTSRTASSRCAGKRPACNSISRCCPSSSLSWRCIHLPDN